MLSLRRLVVVPVLLCAGPFAVSGCFSADPCLFPPPPEDPLYLRTRMNYSTQLYDDPSTLEVGYPTRCDLSLPVTVNGQPVENANERAARFRLDGLQNPVEIVIEYPETTWRVVLPNGATTRELVPVRGTWDSPPGTALQLAWTAEGDELIEAFYQVWGAYSFEGDGLDVGVPTDAPAGEATVLVDVFYEMPVSECDGPTECVVEARYGQQSTFAVNRP